MFGNRKTTAEERRERSIATAAAAIARKTSAAEHSAPASQTASFGNAFSEGLLHPARSIGATAKGQQWNGEEWTDPNHDTSGAPAPRFGYKLRLMDGNLLIIQTTGFHTETVSIPARGARVEMVNQKDNSRVTATRALTIGLFALGAKKKKSSITLIITGADGTSAVPSPFKNVGRVRHADEAAIWAARFNAWSGATTEPAADTSSLGSQIAELSDLHTQGVLSDDEFAAAKAGLISGK